jgi:hypothetical protein
MWGAFTDNPIAAVVTDTGISVNTMIGNPFALGKNSQQCTKSGD